MKIRCAVDQAEALRQGVDAPKATVLIEVEPASLSEYARDVIADKLVKGHDLTGFRDFHLVRGTKDEFLEKVAGLDEELKNQAAYIRSQISSMLRSAQKRSSGTITFVVARLEDGREIKCFETTLPNNFKGRMGFWPFWDIAPDYERLGTKMSLKQTFFQEAVNSALKCDEIAPLAKQVAEIRETDRATAERIAKELLLSSDKMRLKRLSAKHDLPWTTEEYEKGNVLAWDLDKLLVQSEKYPAWTFEIPSASASLFDFVPVSNLSASKIEPFLDALKELPKDAQVWMKDDEMAALLNRRDDAVFAAWREDGIGRFAFCEIWDT
jgi:hypothetical protein